MNFFQTPGRFIDHTAGDPAPRTKTITHFSKEQYGPGNDWPPEDAAEFLRWFMDKLATIPPEYEASAEISIDSESGYEGSSSAKIEITYSRPETAAEIADRIAEYRQRVAAAEQAERAQFEQLKAKFGG